MRTTTFTLMGIGLAALSCQLELQPVEPVRAAAVAATAEESVGVDATASASPLSEAAPGAAAASGLDGALAAEPEEAELSAEEEILAQLRSRHTALADHELIALSEAIVEESERHGLDPVLVMAVIHVESAGYHLAVSRVGALGLMQLMPATGAQLAARLGVQWHGADSLFDPIVNVKLGTAYLRELTDRYDSTQTALAAYNWGPGRIDRRLRRGATVPSRYIEQVMKAYDAYGPPDSERS